MGFDVSQLDTKTGAEEGRFLHLRHVLTNALMFHEGEKVGVTVRGYESPTVKAAAAKANALRMDGKDDEADFTILRANIIAFHNLDRDGRPLTTSDADMRWFFDLSDALNRQIVSFAAKPGNFVPPASGS